MATVQTVRGVISADELGMTLPHEHLFTDLRFYWRGEPKEISKKFLFSQPVTLENRSEVVYNTFFFKDNLLVDDVDSAIEEVKAFLGYGGSTIVDLTGGTGLGRDPVALRYVAGVTGANIVMATGRYSEPSLTEAEKAMSPDDIARAMVDEFTNGVDRTGVKPGVIGEVAINDMKNQIEINGLRGAARAQKKIGCALNIHPILWETHNHEILDILEEEGADPNKVIFSHEDFTMENLEYHDSLAKRGAYVEYDTFGCEAVAEQSEEEKWFPSDGERIRAVKKQVALGNEDRILISGDMCFKFCFTKWGGWGYAHIPKHIVPRMKKAGITDEQIYKIMVENPKRAFAF